MLGWLRLVSDAIFPADCEACGAPLSAGQRTCLCPVCRSAMPPPSPPLCARCGVPLARSESHCSDCERHPPAFASARAVGLYLAGADALNPLALAVQRLKYGRRRMVADALGGLLAERYPFGSDVVLVPVPLHVRRLRARGFNQAILLAGALGRRRALPVAGRALARTRATAAQPGLGAEERHQNLRDAFIVRRAGAVSGRHVVLIDDVLTTGATADACSRVLLAAGAARVDVYTVGRAP